MGLTTAQIAAANWDETKPGLPLFRQLVRDKVAKAMQGRAEIQNAPDDTMRAIQEARHRNLESEVLPIRVMGDAVVSGFFAADKTKAREKARADVESQMSGHPPRWDLLEAAAARLRAGETGITPFHWPIEFPEVFARDNGGFDAIVGNPPFLGGRKISGEYGTGYLAWLMNNHADSHGNADLVAHFFRRGFILLRDGGCLGFIATNTIRQGDTRSSGLAPILRANGRISRAVRRLRWPGDAAVVVSVVHIDKNLARIPQLDEHVADCISCYLLNSNYNDEPAALANNAKKAFQGTIVLGNGFTFDDKGRAKGVSASLEDMNRLLNKSDFNKQKIFPYIGGEEVNNSPQQRYSRYVIDFGLLPMRFRDANLWDASSKVQRQEFARRGYVEPSFKGAAIDDWPDLVAVLERYAESERARSKNKDVREYPWWRHWRPRPDLNQAISGLQEVLVTNCGAAPHLAFCFIPAGSVFAHSLVVTVMQGRARFAVLQSRVHELWARFFSSSMKDDLRYTPSDCFRTFPFPATFEPDPSLEAAGEAYHAFRAQLMIDRNEGLTKIYNRFHARGENATDIVRLRALHAEMDATVLRAYGWDDLADRAAPEFIEQDADEGKTPKTRLDWPAEFKDEVLARLLALNATLAAAERAAGLTVEADDDNEEIEDAVDAE